jgi:hypothetical protein
MSTPIKTKESVKRNEDPHIDQDFEGFPGLPAKKSLIKPETNQQKKMADKETKDGEKELDKRKLKKN